MPFLLNYLFLCFFFFPTITDLEMFFFRSSFSVITGIYSLFAEHHYALAIIIALFSVAFPLFKLVTLGLLWFGKIEIKKRNRITHWLGVFGKWSMLDVFVVAVTIVITKISKFAEAEPRVGIYCFCASVMLTMIITEKIAEISSSESS